ncbi:MAG: MFS transporter [Bacteriovoracaceae bacterium]|nr:MFS transporter [Bacteriovoracaceae bacterium]
MKFIITRIYKKYPFPPLVWFMIIETAFARGAFFLAMPFIALRMYENAENTPTLIGVVLGVGPFVGTIAGFYVGHLSDLWGRRQILFWSLILWSTVFLGFSSTSSTFMFAILMAFNGLARAAFEPVSAALVSDLCTIKDPSGELQKSAFHLRYFSINIGAAIAPLIGASLMIRYPALGFQIASFAYLLSALSFRFFSKKYGMKAQEKAREKVSHEFKDVMSVLLRDKTLQIYLLAFFLLSLAFSQIDSILTLHLKDLFSHEGVKLFGRLLSLNGILVVLCTLPILKFTKKFDLNKSCAMSCLLWGVGYFIFGFAKIPLHFYWAMFFVTLGEIVVFANGNLIIETLAPAKMKGAYLGTTNLGYSGVVIGPALGGILMQWGGGELLFSTMSMLMILVAYLYMAARKNGEKNIIQT